MTQSTQLKEWITRPEIEQMFHISSSTFSSWRSRGRFGDPIGTLPGRGGVGRDLNMYSMATVMKLYEILKFDIARRAIAKGVPASLFPEYCAYVGIEAGDVESRFTFSEWVGVAAPVVVWITEAGQIITPEADYSDDTPYYDGLPARLHNSERAAEVVEAMCHWVQERGDARSQTHRSFHYDSPCPYASAAAVLRGEPDPRESDKSDKCSDTPKGDDTDSY